MRNQTSANTEIGESRVTYYNFHYVVKLAEKNAAEPKAYKPPQMNPGDHWRRIGKRKGRKHR